MVNTPPTIDLDRLKQAMPIMDLASFLGLEIRGRQARCYNSQAHKHNDRSFSLGLDIQRNRYKCFACGEQGSIIDLFMAIKGVDLSQAIKELAEMIGLTPMSHQTAYKATSTPYKAEIRQPEPPSEPLGAYSDIYEELYFYCIGLDQEGGQYLKGRGLAQETLDRFLLFSVKDYQATDKHLKDKFSKDQLQRAGVIGEKGNLIFYKHKIIIPFLQDGRIIFLQGRRLDQEQPKYLHLKRPVPLYNADALAETGRDKKIYICEGVFDAMMLEQNGYKAVGILGVNNFKPDYTEFFKGLDVVLALDNDEAGERGTKELAKMFLIKGQGVSSKQLPDGIKDITDYFLNL
jgi:DNA primase